MPAFENVTPRYHSIPSYFTVINSGELLTFPKYEITVEMYSVMVVGITHVVLSIDLEELPLISRRATFTYWDP